MSSTNSDTQVQICDQDGTRWVPISSLSRLLKSEKTERRSKYAAPQEDLTEQEQAYFDRINMQTLIVWPWFLAALIAGALMVWFSSDKMLEYGLSADVAELGARSCQYISVACGFAWLVLILIKNDVHF